MRSYQIIILIILSGIWIWSLPILMVAAFFMIPMACLSIVVLFILGTYFQYTSDGNPMVDHWLRRFISKIPWHEWFPCNQLKIDSGIIAAHPHGILCCGTLAGIHFVPGSRTCMCIAPIVFYVPIIGIAARYLGCIPATKKSMSIALQQGLPVLVVPGGVPEIVIAERQDDCQRFKRHGFLRLAKDCKSKVTAVFINGECSLYKMFRGPFLQARIWISWRLNIPLVFPIMLGWYGSWVPKRHPLHLSYKEILTYEPQTYDKELEKLFTDKNE